MSKGNVIILIEIIAIHNNEIQNWKLPSYGIRSHTNNRASSKMPFMRCMANGWAVSKSRMS